MGSDMFGQRVAFVVGAGLLLAHHMAVEGVVISVNWQQNTLLLQSGEGFPPVAVDPTAVIDDPAGAIHTLSDLQPGDVIEWQGEFFGGLLIAHKLRVISISGDTENDERGHLSRTNRLGVISPRHT